MEKKFLSISEVMEFLGISRPTIYRLLSKGMPCYRLGGRRIFDREELIDWVKGHRNDKPKKKGGVKPSARRKK